MAQADISEAVEEGAQPELVTLKTAPGTIQCSQPVGESDTVYVLGHNISGEITGGSKDYHSEVQIAKQKSEGLAEKIESLEKQFDEKLEVITTDAEKSKDEIAALRKIVDQKSLELVSMSSLLREKDNRIKDLQDELKKRDDEVRKKDDELQQRIEEKQKLEEQVVDLQHDVTLLKSQMDAMKNNLDSKKEEKPIKLPDEVKSMVQLALSEFQTTLGKALHDSYVDKMSIAQKAKKAATSKGSEPPSNTALSNNGRSSPSTNNFK